MSLPGNIFWNLPQTSSTEFIINPLTIVFKTHLISEATSLLLISPLRVSCLEVEDELEESNCSGSLYTDFFLLLLKKLSLFSKISLCLPPEV